MADDILGGDLRVYNLGENRQKRIEWIGSATSTRTVNEVYSALSSYSSTLSNMSWGAVMSAQTPTEYTIGIIDPADAEPWFVDQTTVEHFTGGAITTAGWTRTTGTATGLVVLDYTVGGGVDLVSGDKGLSVVHSVGGDDGTLLGFQTDGSSGQMWVRPDTNAAADDWDSTGVNINVTGGTGASLNQTAAALDGESLWANIFTIGTIQQFTHIYIQQDGLLLTAFEGANDWWSDGQIDILVLVKEADVEIDEAVIQVFARRYTATYSFFEQDLTLGGRNPIPLQTGVDLNNSSGLREMVLTTVAGGTYTVGFEVRDDSDATIQGVITSVAGSGANQTIQYYLIGDPLNDFTGATGVFTEFDLAGASTGITATAVAPTDVNAGALAGVTIVHAANETFDIDEDGTTENYSIVFDVSLETLGDAYEWSKFQTRRGETGTGNTDGQEGQFYVGTQTVVVYTTLTNGPLNEGATVTQVATGATGTVLAHNTTDNILVLRNVRGTFDSTNQIDDDGSSAFVTGPTSRLVSPIVSAPFGTFAGGIFFGAPGLVFDNVPGADANNFRLIDDDNNQVQAPTKVTATLGNSRVADVLTMYRLLGAGLSIDKAEYAATVQSIGDATVVVGSTITADTPGTAAGGRLVLVGVDEDTEYTLRYSSFTGAIFTLANTVIAAADAGTDSNTITEAGAFATAQVGDLIINITRSNAVSYITVVTDANSVEIDPPITGQTTGDSIEVNAVPIATTAADSVYVPIISVVETVGTDGAPGNEAATMTYLADIPVLIRARNAGLILPYEAEAIITVTGLSNNVIRTPDTIFT